MPDTEWMTNVEAATILGVSTGYIATLAKRKRWRSKGVPRSNGRAMMVYSKRDVTAALDGEELPRTLIFTTMRDWADSLPAAYVPTETEMAKHVERPFTAQDMKSLIETRKYRRAAQVQRPRKDPS